ncbi:MAG: chaperone NapD [Azonexus sp.]
MRIRIIASHGGVGLPKLEEVSRMNISSAILYIAPERLYEACEALLLMPGVDIHARSPEGKVVVTLEDDDTNSAADKYVALHGVPGVASVAMVYQYSDDESVNTEEVKA